MDKTNKELEESITADNVEKITGAQIEKYIDAQNFKALEHITKFLSADEYELWSKNGFEGRTFELLMKQRAKNVKESTELEEDMVDMLIQKFKDSGRVAVRYPKKRLVSVSGRSMPEKDAIETMKRILDKEAGVKEAVEKIACLKCDEVSTATAWHKNKGFCPVCKTSSQGVAESEELQEMQELREFYTSIDEDVDEIFEGFGPIAQEALSYAVLLPYFGVTALAILWLHRGPSGAAELSTKSKEEIKQQIELAKKRVDADELRKKKEHIEKSLEKLKELQKDPKKKGLISKGLDFVKAKYKKAALKRVDNKLKPHLDREKDEKEAEEAKAKEKAAEAEKLKARNEKSIIRIKKIMAKAKQKGMKLTKADIESLHWPHSKRAKEITQQVEEVDKKELQEMQELFAVVDENDIVLATASNELAAKRSISSSELPPLSVKDKSKLRIVKTRKTAQVGAPLKEQVDLQTLRTMKIVSLATGCTDSAALYEYALTAPTYTSLVELKENFNRYLQDA